jgi:hypothetical protein
MQRTFPVRGILLFVHKDQPVNYQSPAGKIPFYPEQKDQIIPKIMYILAIIKREYGNGKYACFKGAPNNT